MEYRYVMDINDLIKMAHCEKVVEYLYEYIRDNRPEPTKDPFDMYDKAQANLLKLQKYMHGDIDLEEWDIREQLQNLNNLGFVGISWRGFLSDLEDYLQNAENNRRGSIRH